MATKIKETPILYGKDAAKFLRTVEKNLKKDHIISFERAKEIYRGITKNKKGE